MRYRQQTMTYEFLKTGVADRVAWIEYRRPPLNAIDWTMLREIPAAPKPLLGAIHGTAVGGGLEIVLHCDLRFAAADARLGQPEINIGFIPPVGTTRSLSTLLGRSRALRFLYEGTLVSAEEAREMGLVDFVVPPERLRHEVQAYGAALACKPAQA